MWARLRTVTSILETASVASSGRCSSSRANPRARRRQAPGLALPFDLELGDCTAFADQHVAQYAPERKLSTDQRAKRNAPLRAERNVLQQQQRRANGNLLIGRLR